MHLNPLGIPLYRVTLCHPLLGVITKSFEKAGRWTIFSPIFIGLKSVSLTRRSGYISGLISISLGYLVLSLGLVFCSKVDRLTYSPQAQLKIYFEEKFFFFNIVLCNHWKGWKLVEKLRCSKNRKMFSFWEKHNFSPTRPSGPSWSSSRDVCLFLSWLFLCLFLWCPLFM